MTADDLVPSDPKLSTAKQKALPIKIYEFSHYKSDTATYVMYYEMNTSFRQICNIESLHVYSTR